MSLSVKSKSIKSRTVRSSTVKSTTEQDVINMNIIATTQHPDVMKGAPAHAYMLSLIHI